MVQTARTLGNVRLINRTMSRMFRSVVAASTRPIQGMDAVNQGAVQRNHKGARLDLHVMARGSSNDQT
jgi:hypothetical protein